MPSITTVEIVFMLYFDENNEFQKNKRIFGSVFPSGSDETMVRSSGVILAIFGHFGKIEKAHIGEIYWTGDFCKGIENTVGNLPVLRNLQY